MKYENGPTPPNTSKFTIKIGRPGSDFSFYFSFFIVLGIFGYIFFSENTENNDWRMSIISLTAIGIVFFAFISRVQEKRCFKKYKKQGFKVYDYFYLVPGKGPIIQPNIDVRCNPVKVSILSKGPINKQIAIENKKISNCAFITFDGINAYTFNCAGKTTKSKILRGEICSAEEFYNASGE